MNQEQLKHALILGAGEDVPVRGPHRLAPAVVICADGGAQLARKWGLRPAIIIGDLDSIEPSCLNYWQRQGVPVQKHPAQKDHTDVELAVNYALKLGVKKISLAGAWGSRADHSLGNLEIMYRLALAGIKNELLTKNSRFTAFCQKEKRSVSLGSTVSLLPLSKQVRGVHTQGLVYPLQKATLKKGTTLGVSNRANQEEIMIECTEGVLLAIFEQ